MTDSIHEQSADSRYHPEYLIPVPPLYQWPLSPLRVLRYLLVDLLFPWGYVFLLLAYLSWGFFTPALATMSVFSVDWMLQIWLRNALLLTLIAGGLHWWFYIRKSQHRELKFDQRWQARGDDRFLFKNQVRDNMFWSLVSGVTIWTGYESITWWIYANGHQEFLTFADHTGWVTASIVGVFVWGTLHFYFVHRLLHVKKVYQLAHELHHRNVNVGPWSGISMHPLEHLLYFSVFIIWWVVPAHPVAILLTAFFNGISPAVSHSGFDFMKLGGKWRITVGDYFHTLHHKYFHINYGNTVTPLDKAFGSWHDGGESGRAVLKQRLRRGISH